MKEKIIQLVKVELTPSELREIKMPEEYISTVIATFINKRTEAYILFYINGDWSKKQSNITMCHMPPSRVDEEAVKKLETDLTEMVKGEFVSHPYSELKTILLPKKQTRTEVADLIETLTKQYELKGYVTLHCNDVPKSVYDASEVKKYRKKKVANSFINKIKIPTAPRGGVLI